MEVERRKVKFLTNKLSPSSLSFPQSKHVLQQRAIYSCSQYIATLSIHHASGYQKISACSNIVTDIIYSNIVAKWVNEL